MIFRIRKFLAYLRLKLANAFASKKVRHTMKVSYLANYCVNATVMNEFMMKHEALEQKWVVVRNLALGSSHGYHGFLPDGNSFNLCGNSQDLYLSYELYRRCADLAKLKTVILFYSVFSPGFDAERTSEMDYCLYYRYFWRIPLRYHGPDDFAHKRYLLDKYLRQHPLTEVGDYRGENDYGWFFPSQMSVAERVASHLKNNRRQNGQTGYVGKMAELARIKGHRLVVVVPPFRSDYSALLPPFEETFAELLALVKQNPEIKLMSFVDDKDFVDADFGDMDHLNRQGATKLTAKILSAIRKC